MYLINVFLFYSILGNIFERILMYFVDRTYVSGFMGTIFTPIYGIAMLLVLFVHNKLKIGNKFLKIIVEFIIFFILLSLIELLGGVLIYNIFNKVYWNYDNYKFNLGKYISLESGLIWASMSLVILYLVHPLFKKIENHIPKFITIFVSVVFIVNIIFVFLVK